jgi:hypothetical protein
MRRNIHPNQISLFDTLENRRASGRDTRERERES